MALRCRLSGTSAGSTSNHLTNMFCLFCSLFMSWVFLPNAWRSFADSSSYSGVRLLFWQSREIQWLHRMYDFTLFGSDTANKVKWCMTSLTTKLTWVALSLSECGFCESCLLAIKLPWRALTLSKCLCPWNSSILTACLQLEWRSRFHFFYNCERVPANEEHWFSFAATKRRFFHFSWEVWHFAFTVLGSHHEVCWTAWKLHWSIWVCCFLSEKKIVVAEWLGVYELVPELSRRRRGARGSPPWMEGDIHVSTASELLWHRSDSCILRWMGPGGKISRRQIHRNKDFHATQTWAWRSAQRQHSNCIKTQSQQTES